MCRSDRSGLSPSQGDVSDTGRSCVRTLEASCGVDWLRGVRQEARGLLRGCARRQAGDAAGRAEDAKGIGEACQAPRRAQHLLGQHQLGAPFYWRAS